MDKVRMAHAILAEVGRALGLDRFGADDVFQVVEERDRLAVKVERLRASCRETGEADHG